MKQKLKKEIQDMIDRKACNIFTTDIKHKMYSRSWIGAYYDPSSPVFSMASILNSLLEHCNLELDYVQQSEKVVVKKKEPVKKVVYKKRAMSSKK